MKRILVTGSTGCIGSSVVRYLLEHGVETVVGFTRSKPEESTPDGFEHVQGDITDVARITQVLKDVRPDRIIHLAAFQTPDCQANPFFGMDVNMTATAELFKAAARELPDLDRFVFASSVAVHGPRAAHASDKVGPEALFCPPNLYGFWKIAGEGMAQAFHMETQIPTVSLRLATTYGPGRDRGMTSAPTTAMKAAVLGVDFEIPYSGREHYHFVHDVGAGFSEAAIAPFQGYGAFHIPGTTVPIADFCELIGEMADDMPAIESAGKTTIQKEAPVVPFSCDLDHEPTLAAFPNMPLTPVREGVQQSLDTFLAEKISGDLTTADIH